MSRTKKQEQLFLPDLEPVIEVTPQAPLASSDLAPSAPLTLVAGSTQAPAPALRPSKANQPGKSRPRRKAVASPKEAAETPSAGIGGAQPTTPTPQLSYNRQEDSLHIQLLAAPVLEDRSSDQLSAGYTAEGQLAELHLFKLSRHIRPLPAPVHQDQQQLLVVLANLREELLFLKAGLALVLACVLWLLLR